MKKTVYKHTGGSGSRGRILPAILLLILVLCVTTVITGARARSNLVKRNPAPGRLVDIGGYKMHINCAGEGNPTVILVAGLDDFSIFWSQVQAEAAKSTRVCSYDRAGLGWSDPSPHPRTSKIMVEELHLLLANADIGKPFVMVGHSFGAALVRLYANNYPKEIEGIVLVDGAPDDLFARIPKWSSPIRQKTGLFRTLAPLSSIGLLAFVPESIPNRGMPDDVLAQYRAIAVSTEYFKTGAAENEAFESNLAEVHDLHISLGVIPLIVISRGYMDPIPGFSDSDNQQAWQSWQEMQAEFLTLSSESKQIIATESEHNINLQQPDLVIDAIRVVMQAMTK